MMNSRSTNLLPDKQNPKDNTLDASSRQHYDELIGEARAIEIRLAGPFFPQPPEKLTSKILRFLGLG